MEITRGIVSPEMRFGGITRLPPPPLRMPEVSAPSTGKPSNNTVLVVGVVALVCVCWWAKVRVDRKKKMLEEQKS